MTPELSLNTVLQLFPILGLIGLVAVNLIVEVYGKEKSRIWNGVVSLFGVAVLLSAIALLNFQNTYPWLKNVPAFAGTLHFNPLASLAAFVILGLTLLGLLFVLGDEEVRCGEVYALINLSAVGMVLMVASEDLLSIFLGLEVMSLSVFALVGSKRTDLLSNEASLKYFLLGAFSSAIFLYGIALIFGACGGVSFEKIRMFFNSGEEVPPYAMAGIILIAVGFAFKVGLVPFHMWLPDAYEGAPSSITAFMASGVKAAAFVAFLRVFYFCFSSFYGDWSPILSVLSVVTMTLGNLAALGQKTLKRMLAYSSISHAGYILLAVISCKTESAGRAVSALIYYVTAYGFLIAGAFGVVLAVELLSGEAYRVDDDESRLAGLGWRHPWLSASLSLFLLSAAGIPPTAGFLAKFYVFSAAIDAGYYGLVIAAVLNSLLALYYYLRPILWMYMTSPRGEESGSKRKVAFFDTENPYLAYSYFISFALFVAAFISLFLGLFPGHFTQMTQEVQGVLQVSR